MLNGRFQDQVVVITGVSDRGIGGAIAERLASEGAAIAILWHERPTRLINRLTKRNAEFIELNSDVTSQESVLASIQAVVERFGRIDVLVNNAGVDHTGALEETTDDAWQQVVDVNLTGSMRMIRETLPHLADRTSAIVNLASVLGIAGCAGFPAYSATKAGIIGLTQSLAMELAPRGIRAVCIAPALVHTPMTHKYVAGMTSQTAEQIEQSHPLGVGTPQDVASVVAFIASSEARWITGITVPLGWSAAFPLPLQQFLPQRTSIDSTPQDDHKAASILPLRADQTVQPPQRRATG